MANRLTDLNVEFVSLVDRAAVRDPQNPTEPQRFLVWKADTGRGDTPTTDPVGGTMTEEEMRAAVAKAEQERDEAREASQKAETERQAAVAKADELEKAAKATETDPAADDVNKADLSPAVRARLEKAEADAAAATARIEKAEQIAKEERDHRINREFVAKAAEYTGLPVDAETFGPVLKSAAEKLSKEELGELDRVLKAADEQISRSNLLKEMGRGGEARVSDGETSLTQKAEAIRKSDPSLTQYQAMQKAMREDPEAQARYVASHQQ